VEQGDLEAFMSGYHRSPDMTFFAGGDRAAAGTTLWTAIGIDTRAKARRWVN
jgi:hypothetical protein